MAGSPPPSAATRLSFKIHSKLVGAPPKLGVHNSGNNDCKPENPPTLLASLTSFPHLIPTL